MWKMGQEDFGNRLSPTKKHKNRLLSYNWKHFKITARMSLYVTHLGLMRRRSSSEMQCLPAIIVSLAKARKRFQSEAKRKMSYWGRKLVKL